MSDMERVTAPTTAPPLTREAAQSMAQRNGELVARCAQLTLENNGLQIEVGALRAELGEAKAVASWLLVILLSVLVGFTVFATSRPTGPAAPAAGHVNQESTTQGGNPR